MQTQSNEADRLIRSANHENRVADLLGINPGEMPLKEYCIYRGSDFGMAGVAVSSVSDPRTFEPTASDSPPFIELHRARLRHSEIGMTFNNVETRLRTKRTTNFYSLSIILSGHQVSKTDDGQVTTRAPYARLHSAGSVYDIHRSTGYKAVIVNLSIAGFEHFVGDKVDLLTPPDSSFSLMLDVSQEQFALFTSILGALLKALGERAREAPQNDIVIARLEEAMWFAFADACPELYMEYNQAGRAGIVPAPVKRVVSFIQDNIQRDLTLSNLVEVSGMSARTLYSGFHEGFGIGPMAYLKQVKLNRCREDLLSADPANCLVGDIAAIWGFFHLSSFAQVYRKEFGELPSETLKCGK